VDVPPVICAFEASPPARRAVEAAAWLAGALQAPLAVIHVFDSGDQPALPREGDLLDPLVYREVRIRGDRRARSLMRETLLRLVEPLDGEISTEVLEGSVVPVLHGAARERGAALLVSGTSARSGLDHVLQGSVAGSLLRAAPCPVVMVRPGVGIAESGPLLVGDDGSDHARRAAGHAAALADRLGRECVRLQADGDDPARELAAAARDRGACLVAAGTRGRGPLRAEVLGSVSSALVRTAERPIMLVPASAGDPPAPR
jgi:nucleotide-binding universal stress UspA family protein